MENKFIVLKDEEGNYLPMAFIARNNESGKFSADKYKLDKGEKMVVVEFIEEF